MIVMNPDDIIFFSYFQNGLTEKFVDMNIGFPGLFIVGRELSEIMKERPQGSVACSLNSVDSMVFLVLLSRVLEDNPHQPIHMLFRP